VDACRYPPLGNRSFGPSRGLLYGGPDYVSQANETVMAIPMIETAEAVDRIEEILDVEGVDMVYLGPNDMAFALDGHVGHPRPKSEAALLHVLSAATRRGIPVGIFCSGGDEARMRIGQGFQLVTPGNDFAHLTRSMRDAVRLTLDDTSPEVAAQNGY
jgi:4-hydroxy-2-oxoheptanedioate aldolase